jgi:hypothetical protein
LFIDENDRFFLNTFNNRCSRSAISFDRSIICPLGGQSSFVGKADDKSDAKSDVSISIVSVSCVDSGGGVCIIATGV